MTESKTLRSPAAGTVIAKIERELVQSAPAARTIPELAEASGCSTPAGVSAAVSELRNEYDRPIRWDPCAHGYRWVRPWAAKMADTEAGRRCGTCSQVVVSVGLCRVTQAPAPPWEICSFWHPGRRLPVEEHGAGCDKARGYLRRIAEELTTGAAAAAVFVDEARELRDLPEEILAKCGAPALEISTKPLAGDPGSELAGGSTVPETLLGRPLLELDDPARLPLGGTNPSPVLAAGATFRLDATPLVSRLSFVYMLGGYEFASRATANVGKWGVQELETLVLAATEELGELAQAVLQNRHEGGERERIREEAIDLGALCLQILESLADDEPEEES